MLKIIVGSTEEYNEELNEFSTSGGIEIELEHSLVSLSKWEEEYEIPFLSNEAKTTEQVIKYIEHMTLTPEIAPEVYQKLSNSNLEDISKYIDAKRSATWFRDPPGAPPSREVITSELIYQWMIALEIPFECQYWHLNRLFTLIKICNIKQSKPEQMSRAELNARNRELNAQRRAQLGTKG